MAQTVVVGVTGGIGAYKACELVRALMKRGFRVKVTMTDAATRFVTPLTFRTLTGEPVASSLWEEPAFGKVHHVSLAQEADVMVIAPCTANVIAKIAHGRADDILTTTALATQGALVIAPAMNAEMWRKQVTRDNVAELKSRGAVIVAPAEGELACGDIGEGRLAPLDDIVEAVMAEASRACGLEGVRMLVTAGGTREAIDPVRFIGNRSSGKTGYAIAEEAARRGADVTLVTSAGLPDPYATQVVRVTTALEMQAAVDERFDATDVVVMSAAVADFRPQAASAEKIKKDAGAPVVELVRNPDILAGLGERKTKQLLVGFAAETSDVLVNARKKLAEKRVDLVVANDVGAEGLGFESDVNRVALVSAEGTEELPVLDKQAIARLLLDRVAAMLGRKG